MTAEYTFKWEGDAVNRKVRTGIRWGIDSVMADCVTTAKNLVPKRTTILQGSLQMRPAVDLSDHIAGYWGSFTTKYAPWVEFGTRPHWPPVKAIETSMRVSHSEAFLIARSISRKGTRPHPYLMPAAEQHYPSLGLRIRAQTDWGPS